MNKEHGTRNDEVEAFLAVFLLIIQMENVPKKDNLPKQEATDSTLPHP
jgi:hypothetical protein